MVHNYKNIARLNLEMAKDSKSLVSATKHDSPSMKAAALLLALFLPATFIAVSIQVDSAVPCCRRC